MPDTRFEQLRSELTRGGVAKVYVERTLLELGEHYADLESAALAAGQSADEAARCARDALGDEHAIAAAILARRELLCFQARHPCVANCLHSAAAIGAIPGLPLMYCIEHRPELARYGVALGLAVTLVGGMLATLDWLIFV
ncbi:MAG TPA: hypothetical protein VIQ99_09000 [Gammaproteobacteria bacterium]